MTRNMSYYPYEITSEATPARKPRARRAAGPALFECRECGRKFRTVKAAQAAMFGDRGCPGCGGSDIDVA